MKAMKAEDEKRNWTNEGLTAFSEIVRQNQQELEKLSHECVRFLTKHLNAQQGSLFVINRENQQDIFLELTACYAFDRRKWVEKRIEIGAGLLGQTYLEGETNLLTRVPQGYTSITSGLGDATPGCLLIVPMKYNEATEAILELASFKVFEEHQIRFLEKAGEFVASALLSVRTTEKMRELLEQSQEKTEIMKAQEEEMRQNMEEMQATHEEMERKSREMDELLTQAKAKETEAKNTGLWLQTIIDHLPRGIFWKESNHLSFLGANKIFAGIAGFDTRSIIGKTDFDCPWQKEESEAFRADDRLVIKNRKANLDIEEQNTNAQGETQWVSTSKVPVIDENGEVVAVLGMFEDITERKKEEMDYRIKKEENERLHRENQQLLHRISELETIHRLTS
jgi:PAS domain S-box-containing protein